MVVSVKHCEVKRAGMLTLFVLVRDYFAALIRTEAGFVAPTQGRLINYVERVPLGVVAQITVWEAVFGLLESRYQNPI